MWLGGMSRHVSEVRYVNEAELLKWALSSPSHADTVALYDWKIVECDVKSE